MTQYSINPARLQNNNKLDNPVWHSLDETHKEFSLTFGNLKCYRPGYCPFGGYEDNDIVSNHLDEYAKLIGNFYIVGEKPEFSQQLTLKKELVCWQMVIEHKIDVTINEGIIKLNNTHDKE